MSKVEQVTDGLCINFKKEKKKCAKNSKFCDGGIPGILLSPFFYLQTFHLISKKQTVPYICALAYYNYREEYTENVLRMAKKNYWQYTKDGAIILYARGIIMVHVCGLAHLNFEKCEKLQKFLFRFGGFLFLKKIVKLS